jgi:hypothetical protein
MREAIPPLPNTPSWRGAQLKRHRDTFTLPLLSFIKCNKTQIWAIPENQKGH